MDPSITSGAQLGVGEGEGLSCPFLKIKKKCPGFRKKALTVSIFMHMLNSLFQM